MGYIPKEWNNDELPAMNGPNLRHMEAGIKDAHDSIDTINTIIENLTTYSLDEINTGKKWIDGKTIYIKVIDCGALPNNSIKTIAHDISNIGFLVEPPRGVSYSSSTGHYFPLPYPADSISSQVKLWATSTDVKLQTGADRTDYTETYVILEYVKTTNEVVSNE
ncbi:MAG: hypothetical protein IJ568_05650 [Bacilli bacterium]|nr:hypothetical protein [Bacilli bacterium]